MRNHLKEQEINTMAFKLISVLNGQSFNLACLALKRAKSLLMDGHKVDVSSPMFKRLKEKVEDPPF